MPQDTIDLIKVTLSMEWSPEQISGVCRLIGMSWIYRYVATDRARGGKLYRRLWQGRKRSRRGVNSKRAVIPNPRSIDDRPGVVDTRERFGDWEVDTLGKHGTGTLATLAERKSRMYLVKRVDAKRAVDVRDAVIEMLKPYAAQVQYIRSRRRTMVPSSLSTRRF